MIAGVIRSTAFLFLLASSAAAFAQQQVEHPWQVLSDPSVATLQSSWKTPPPEYGPEPYYGMNGHITLEVVQRDLDTMKSLGFQAVTVQYGYGSDRAYLSPEYFDFFRQFVQEAKKRNMRVWIVDDAGYPSGFAGGKFTAEHPELRMQALISAQKQELDSGATFDSQLSPDTVAVTAIRSSDGEIVQIPFAGGKAHWIAPEGHWTVFVVEHAFRTSPTRSDTNPKRVKDTEQSLEDYLDPAATAQYVAFTHEAYKKAVGDEFGKIIMGFRGDEPDYSIAGLPWTPKFFATFEAKKGYDIRLYLASFLQGKDATLTQKELFAKADYYDVFADLFRDGFFKPQGDWCAANGLEYQVHLNHEEQQLLLAHSEGDFFRDMRFVQVPGIDSIWHQIWTDTVSDFPRFASSAAHVYGHPRAFTESFAAYRPAPDIAMARYILNEQFVRGINLVETMYFPATTGGRGGPMPFMRDPGFPSLMQYTSRISYLMSQGHPAAEVALLLPAESLWMGSTETDDTFVSSERLLSEHQVDFDILDEDALSRLLKMEHGTFLSESGNRYRTVIVPDASFLPAALAHRLQQFASEGGKVVFLGHAPAHLGGNTDLDATASSAKDLAWATIIPGSLPPVPTPPAEPPASAPEPMNVSAEFWNTLASHLPTDTLQLAKPDTALRVAHRELKDGSMYLLFNESGRAFDNEITFPSKGSNQIETWDAQTGETTAISSHRSGGGFGVRVSLAPYATQIFVIRPPQRLGKSHN